MKLFQRYGKLIGAWLLTLGMSWALPITFQWGQSQWQSSTHVYIPLTLTIEKGWKCYGPSQQADTLKRPLELSWASSHNIMSVSPEWPEPTLWQDQGQQAHVYYDTVTVPLNIFLQDRAPARLHLAIEGLSCAEMCMPFHHELSLELTPPAVTPSAWVRMLFFAFLGGLLLNVMPCVLPVLGLKLKGLTYHSPALFKRVCAITSLGIVSGFWSLAALTSVLKMIFHRQVGWGMQLQSPYFSAFMVLIMVAGAYSLLGVFHLNTPQWAHHAGAPTASSKPSIQAFISGLLAVLLATPCSAPFLGPAIGFALTGTPLEIFSFYTAIALGFALPYLLGLFLPIGTWLPKPGPWMLYIERGIGILFLLSAAWLIGWPLASFLSVPLQYAAWILLAVWAFIPCLQRWSHKWPSWKKRTIFYGLPLTMGICLLAFPSLSPTGGAISMVDGKIFWTPWSPRRLEDALQEGRTVFVDVTGKGCALCMVNKRVFSSPRIQQLLTSPGILCMRADYSKGSEDILFFLKRYGRAAIPFNVILHKSYPKGIVLSEFLSEEEVVKALDFIKNLEVQKP